MSVGVRPNGAGLDRPVAAVAVAAVVVAAVGALWLVLASLGGRPHDRTIKVDNRAGLAVQVDAVDGQGGVLGIGTAAARGVSTFHELPDLGRSWTFVFSYGGEELLRQRVAGRDLAARGWTVQVPAQATMALERQGYQ
jgi:hypothetical protein